MHCYEVEEVVSSAATGFGAGSGAGFHRGSRFLLPTPGAPGRGGAGAAGVGHNAADVPLLTPRTGPTHRTGVVGSLGPPPPSRAFFDGTRPRKISGNIFPFLLVFLSCSCLAQLEPERGVFSALSASQRDVPISMRSCSCGPVI